MVIPLRFLDDPRCGVVCLSDVCECNIHIAAGLVDGRYVPGLVTAVVLYIPYYLWLCTCTAHCHTVLKCWNGKLGFPI